MVPMDLEFCDIRDVLPPWERVYPRHAKVVPSPKTGSFAHRSGVADYRNLVCRDTKSQPGNYFGDGKGPDADRSNGCLAGGYSDDPRPRVWGRLRKFLARCAADT